MTNLNRMSRPTNRPMNRPMRRSRRGTLLVVVLGLLVALFVIGTSFSYVTLSERRAAANYMDRQRALDLALDGVEYSMARLRAEATRKHYEYLTPGVAGTGADGDYDPVKYSLRTLDTLEPAVTWPKNQSRTGSDAKLVDGNWVDFDGDGSRGAIETSFGTGLIPAGVGPGSKGFASTVTGFQADGININQIRNSDVAFANNEKFGPSGSYSELGNYFRVRAIDAASLLNINNFKGQTLRSVLIVLGNAIDDWVSRNNPKGEYNPFPALIADDIVKLNENLGGVISNKDQIRPIYSTYPRGEALYALGMMFITVNSYNDTQYRDWAEANTKVRKDPNLNPRNLPDQRLMREGFTGSSATEGRDGWPDWIPDVATQFAKAPVNINTAPKPVLVCLFANLQANARMLFYKKQDQITEDDKLIKDKFGATVRRQNSGTTDLGRQNNRVGGVNAKDESKWYPGGDDNRAIFQLVPIGPISTKFGGPAGATTSGAGGSTDFAVALAEEVIAMRGQAPFTSWQDFDYRFCQRRLLNLPAQRSGMQVPDVVGAGRSSLTGQEVSNVYPRNLLPDAANCDHPANPFRSSDAAMSQAAFRAWYWKSVVDMIRSALNPNNVSARWNPDYPYFQNVDRMDLTNSTAPICFSSMGVYEITSQGEMLARPKGANENTTQTIDVAQLLPVARRQVRAVVKIYDVLRHTTQRDFMTPLDPSILGDRKATSSSTPTTDKTLVAHSHYGTKTFPYSVDELSNGSWDNPSPAWNDAEDARGISYKNGDIGKDKWKGHGSWKTGSNEFGYVAMDPKDRSPIKETTPPLNPLNFWVRFNESLRGRTSSATFAMQGVNSDNASADLTWGHLPWEKGAIFEDFISTATPRSVEAALASSSSASEFENSQDGEQATKYGSLRPDGVFLDGGQLRQRASKSESSLTFTYNKRGAERWARLKILRYPCGSQREGNPFFPISPYNGAGGYDSGIDDSKQQGYVSTTSGGTSIPEGRKRLEGVGAPYRGTDEHNRDAQSHRQLRSNMPYYEGTVDFWIKWDLPPQGTDTSGVSTNAHQIVCMGEIDPASHNYSGLFGATAFGRFKDHINYLQASATNRDSTADFEGVQFFVYKEPGGVFRFTRLYFSEALGMNVDTSSTSSTTSTVTQFGTAMRRIFDQANPWGGYTATNDICNDLTGTPGSTPQNNMGFLYARTDAWVNLSQATANGPDGTKPIMLRVHDWHRFTLSYNSNSNKPYQLLIDGRVIGPVEFYDDPDGLLGYRNDGAHVGPGGSGRDAPVPATGAGGPIYNFFRTTSKLLEINPEDRLTVGCIFRRQRDTEESAYDTWYGEADDQADLVKPSRPVFKFDSNFVAVANATIDDFRIARTQVQSLQPAVITDIRNNSRYAGRQDQEAYFENGFLPVNDADGHLAALPVRLGTISWTEVRPDWDPFNMRGVDLETSNRLEMQWAIFTDISSMSTGGGTLNLTAQKDFGTSGDRIGKDPKGDDYWALGGMSLRGAVLPSGNQVGLLVYRAYFRVSDTMDVNNTSAILDDVTVTLLTPPRKLTFIIDY